MWNPSANMKNYLLHDVENHLNIGIMMDVDAMHRLLTKLKHPRTLSSDLMQTMNHCKKIKTNVVVVSLGDSRIEV